MACEVKRNSDIIFITYAGEYPQQLRGSGFKGMLLLPEILPLDSLDFIDLFAIGAYYRDLRATLVEKNHDKNLKVLS